MAEKIIETVIDIFITTSVFLVLYWFRAMYGADVAVIAGIAMVFSVIYNFTREK